MHTSYTKNNLIELFGLPGSGKTTLYKKLEGVENIEIVTPVSRPSFFWFPLIILESLKVKKISLIRFKLSLLRNLSKRKAVKIGDQIYIDEGWLQRILSFYETKIDQSGLERAISHINLPHKVIILERNIEECFGRYRNSGNVRTMLGKKYLDNWKEVVIHNYYEIIKYMENHSIKHEFIDCKNDLI